MHTGTDGDTSRLLAQNRLLAGVNRIYRDALSRRSEDDLIRTCLAVARDVTGAATASLLDQMESSGGRAGESPADAAVLVVPVQGGGRTVGTLILADRPGAFRPEDRDAAAALAQATGEALAGARERTALLGSEGRLHALVDRIPQMVWRAVDGGEWTWAGPQWTEFTGQAEAESHGHGWLHAVHPDDRTLVRDTWATAIDRGEFHADFRLCHVPERRYRWFQSRATPVRDARGEVVEWLGTSTDVDDLRQLQDHQKVLVAELQHRVRNILTVVRSVFSRTVEAGGSIEDIADHFRGRLDSLARTHVVVTRSAGGQVDLENLIRDELLSVGVADSPTLTIDGPDVALPATAAESIGLAIHELTTNALKYGALKNPTSKLDIHWTSNLDYRGRRTLVLNWVEQGVPAISVKPTRHGFGSELIVEALPYRLGAETSLQFRGGGVRCTISVPLPEPGAFVAPAWKEP